jgi:hypothetical protein
MANYTIPLFVDSYGKIKKGITSGEFYTETNRVILKRGDTVNLAVKFVNDAATPESYLLSAGATVQVGMKEKGRYGSSVPYASFGSTSVTPASASDPYNVSMSVVGSAVDSLIGVGESTEEPYVDVMFEVSWSEDSGATWNSTSDPIEARVYNDVIRNGTDSPTMPAVLNLNQVYQGGIVHNASSVSTTPVTSTATKLDLASIFNLKNPQIVQFEIKAQATFRKAYAAGASSSVSAGFAYVGVVNVDLSSTQNYLTNTPVPFCAELLSDDLGSDVKYGALEVILEGGGLATPNATYKQAAAISLSFKHTAAAVSPETLKDVVWSYQITKIGSVSSSNV